MGSKNAYAQDEPGCHREQQSTSVIPLDATQLAIQGRLRQTMRSQNMRSVTSWTVKEN